MKVCIHVDIRRWGDTWHLLSRKISNHISRQIPILTNHLVVLRRASSPLLMTLLRRMCYWPSLATIVHITTACHIQDDFFSGKTVTTLFQSLQNSTAKTPFESILFVSLFAHGVPCSDDEKPCTASSSWRVDFGILDKVYNVPSFSVARTWMRLKPSKTVQISRWKSSLILDLQDFFSADRVRRSSCVFS